MKNTENKDVKTLQTLGIVYYVYAAMVALFACFPLIHVTIGVLLLSGVIPIPEPTHGGEPFPTHLFGGMFVAVGSIIVLFGWAKAALIFYAGRCLRNLQKHTVCLVAAAVCCFFMPLGTALGVVSLVFLLKDGVRDVFDARDELGGL